MKTSMMIILALAILLAACGKQTEEGAAQSPPAPAPAQRQSATPDAGAPMPSTSSAAPAAPAVTAEKPVSVEPVRPDVKPKVAVMGRDEALALAQQSGCLACHKIEAKLVGPAWQDVSAKYKGDADARARMVAKVKSGGQGNWTEVTGGMPMPPYSPRVSDENIEKLVTFILSL